MKKCFKCGETKRIDEFYKHPQMGDGHLNKCIECTKKDVHENYKKNRLDAYYVIKERLRGRDKHKRLYVGLRKNRYGGKEILQKYNEKYPEKKIAHIECGNAIRSGKLKRMPCEVCGSENVQAHHDDYSKPLDVRWLCVKHHNEHHVKMRELQLLNTPAS